IAFGTTGIGLRSPSRDLIRCSNERPTWVGHALAAQRWVVHSSTRRRYLPPKSRKRLSGCSASTGSSPCRAEFPVSREGTATGVRSPTVVASRYHVASLEKRAKFG